MLQLKNNSLDGEIKTNVLYQTKYPFTIKFVSLTYQHKFQLTEKEKKLNIAQ